MNIIFDKFNSDIFQIKMGNLIDVSSDIYELKSIVSNAEEQGYDHLTVKVSTHNINTVNNLLNQGFKLVDTQLMYCIYAGNWGNVQVADIINYREFKQSDVDQVVKIARKSYVLDQFHSDSDLDDLLCDKYYSEWIKNCCNGLADRVMIIEIDNDIIGYITLNYKANNVVIVGLAAVDERYRGKGFFVSLISNTLRMIYNEGKERLYYGTQLSNIPVLKTMGKFSGFVESSNYVMHLLIK